MSYHYGSSSSSSTPPNARHARFENNSKVKAELFAVSSEVTESSK